jgi:hypothetical protein
VLLGVWLIDDPTASRHLALRGTSTERRLLKRMGPPYGEALYAVTRDRSKILSRTAAGRGQLAVDGNTGVKASDTRQGKPERA